MGFVNIDKLITKKATIITGGSADADGKPVFTYRVGVNGDLELDFGPSMGNKEVGIEIEEVWKWKH